MNDIEQYMNGESTSMESDLKETRERVSEDWKAIKRKLNPVRAVQDFAERSKELAVEEGEMIADGAKKLAGSLKKNPYTFALVGIGLGLAAMLGTRIWRERQNRFPARMRRQRDKWVSRSMDGYSSTRDWITENPSLSVGACALVGGYLLSSTIKGKSRS